MLYNSPKLLEISTNGRVNVDISDDPLYNKVNGGIIHKFPFSTLDLETVPGTSLHSDPALAGPGHLQHEGVPCHQGKQEEVQKIIST